MYKQLKAAASKLLRDQSMPLPVLVNKSLRYAWELGTAPIKLMGVDQVGRGVRTLGTPRIENFGSMTIGANTSVRSVNVPVELCTAVGARLTIGKDCSINYGVSIGATGSITLGDRVRIGPYVMIVDSNFHDAYNRSVRPAPEPVIIEDDVWIGAKACIMPGVTIGRGSIVGTGAVVTRDVPAFSVVVGVPAKVVKTLDAQRFKAQETA